MAESREKITNNLRWKYYKLVCKVLWLKVVIIYLRLKRFFIRHEELEIRKEKAPLTVHRGVMKKYLVYGVRRDGGVESYQCFANSKEDAEADVIRVQGNLVSAKAFDWNIQFRA